MTVADQDRVLASRYRLTSLLHRGCGVDTFRGEDLAALPASEGPRPVVVKLGSMSTRSDTARRLDHEREVLGRLEHPNLVPLLDGGDDGDHLYLVTPWVPGISLAERLADGPLSVPESVTVARCLADALCHAHDHGVLHRDVKPSNVIVGGDPVDRAVLVDFGFARSHLLAEDLRDVPVGTVRYLAPEQAGVTPGMVDERSDLYSLGLTLHECLRGRPVFAADTVAEVLREQMAADPPRLDPPVPRVLSHIVDRLLARDPAKRYQSAAAVLFDLEELAAGLERGVAEPAFTVGTRDRRETLAEPSFVGREDELAALEARVEDAAQGRGGLVLVGAESGGGKTRLLDELAERAGGRARLLRGQGLDQAAQRPFQVLAGVTTGVAESAEADLVERLQERLGDDAEAAAVAFPELGPVLDREEPAMLGPEEFGEVRTLRAVASLLDVLGTPERPALVLLDDCQWADALSARLLAHWEAHRTEPCHVLVVAAYRSEEVGPESVLHRLDTPDRYSLPPLEEDKIASLTRSMAGELPDAALTTTTRLAEGSPFMAAAVLRGLVETGALVSGPDGWEVQPAALADVQSSRRAGAVLARRIDLLAADTRRILGVGAILGKEFDPAIAASLAGVDPVDMARAVRDASRRHLLWARDGGKRCSFVHDKVRETLLALFTEEECRELHERTATLLERHDPTLFFDLAFHFDAAGRPDQALPYALTAAEQARAQHSLDVAEQQYRIAERGATADRDIRRRISEDLGRVLMLRGRYQEAAAKLEAARDLADDNFEFARIDGSLGELAFQRGKMSASSEALERALRTLGQRVPRRAWVLFVLWEVLVQAVHTLAPSRVVGRRSLDDGRSDLLAARLYSRLAHTYWFQRGSVPTLFVHLRGLNLAERYPPTAELAQACSEHAPVMTLLPWYRRGIEYAERSLAIRRDLGDVWGEGQSLHFYGVVLYAASRWEECLQRCREGIRLLERTGDQWEVNTARWHVAYAYYRLGQLAPAAELGEQVWRTGADLGAPQARGIGLAVWSKATGGAVPAEATTAEVASLADDVHNSAEVLSADAVRLMGEGRADDAVDRLERADRLVRDAGLRQEYVAPVPCWLLTAMRAQREQWPVHTALADRRRHLRRARRLARRARRRAGRYRNNLAHACREFGLVEAELGHHRRARRLLDRSVSVAEELGADHELAYSRIARGEIGRRRGWDGATEDLESGHRLREVLESAVRPGERDLVTVSLLDRFDTLLSAGRQVAASLTTDGAFAALTEAAESLLRPQDCLVLAADHLVRPLGVEELRVVSGSGSEPSRTILERALHTDGTVVVHEAADDAVGDSAVLSGVRSVLCAPISVRGAPVAYLYLSHRDLGGVFGQEEVRIADFVTALAGAALENAEGFAEVEALTSTLEQRVSERTAELTDANRQLDERLSELGAAYEREQEIIQQLQRLDQFKTELVGMAAHDLRTPMTVLIGFASTLQDRWDQIGAEQRRSLLQRIVTNTRRLSAFVENLLQFARIESDELRVDWSPFDFHALVERTVAELQATEPERRFDVTIAEDLPLVVGDESRQWQVLQNLLSNAVKHSPPEAPIAVEVTDRGNHLEVAVRDSGGGIPAEELPKLFEKFAHVDNPDAPKQALGTGLGLYICRSVVEAHGGRIEVDSTVGEGTTFTYTVPVADDTDVAADTDVTADTDEAVADDAEPSDG